MNAHSDTIDRWRKFFRSADGDIFDVLEFAIVVAASDCPDHFRIRRGEIDQKLFACGLLRSADCESVSVDGDDGSEEFRAKERKVVSSSSDDDDERNRTSNYSYDDAEALTMAIEESSQIVDEVLRIKLVLEDPDETLSTLPQWVKRRGSHLLLWMKELSLRQILHLNSLSSLMEWMMTRNQGMVVGMARARNKKKNQMQGKINRRRRLKMLRNMHKSKCSDDMLVKVKLEAAKRKLHEGYQQAENAKKQWTIQVMELHDLPKQGLLRKNPHPKPGFHNRKWNNKTR